MEKKKKEKNQGRKQPSSDVKKYVNVHFEPHCLCVALAFKGRSQS